VKNEAPRESIVFSAVVRFRALILLATAAVTVVLALQIPNLRMDPDTEAYVPEGHPVRTYWTEAKEEFGLGRDILVAIESQHPDGVFTPEILAVLDELTEAIKFVDGVSMSEVRSLSDSEAMLGTDDGLDVQPFFDEVPRTREESLAVREMVFDNPVYLDRLVSRDGTIAVIHVRVHQDGEDRPSEVSHRISQLAETFSVPDGRILVAGNPTVEYVYGRQMADDLARLIPLALFAVIVILFLCFPSLSYRILLLRSAFAAVAVYALQFAGAFELPLPAIAMIALSIAMLSARGVFLPTLVVAISVIWTWGIQALLDLPIYIAGTLVPPLLLAIGAADGIHVMERYIDKARIAPEADAKTLVIDSMHELWRPICLTSITTAVGFGSLMVGQMAVYRVFGFTTALGILAAMFASLTVLPAVLSWLPRPVADRRPTGEAAIGRALVRTAEWVEGHRKLVAGSGLALFVFFCVSSLGLRVAYSWIESLAPDTQVLEADRVLRARHGGTMPMNVIVRAPEADGIKDPGLLRGIDAALDEMADDSYVGDTRSIAEYIKRMAQAMNEDREEEFAIPNSPELVAQYLLLYSMSGDPVEYDDLIDYDYQAANLSVLLRTDQLAVVGEQVGRMEAVLDKHVRSLGASATITGSAMVQSTVLNMILTSQIYSLATACFLVMVFMSILFRSIRDASICMIPVAFTGAVNFGGMAALDIPLGPDKAMVSAIALGIGIDYSIHLMSKFHDTLAEGMTVYQGIVEAMRTTGRAILFNGAVVVAGFAVLGFSVAPSNATFGFMIASNMAISCFAALTILPAVLTLVGHFELKRAAGKPVRIGGRLIDAQTTRALGLGGEST
jgi:predicted RND superfamily exporter protein